MKKQTIHVRDEITRQRVVHFIEALTIERDGAKPLAWTVTVAQFRKKRTLSQNALMHKWFAEIADFTGDSESSVKADLKEEFSPKIESKVTAGKFRPMDTHEMSTTEISEFMDRMLSWASGFGISLTITEEPHRADYR